MLTDKVEMPYGEVSELFIIVSAVFRNMFGKGAELAREEQVFYILSALNLTRV